MWPTCGEVTPTKAFGINKTYPSRRPVAVVGTDKPATKHALSRSCNAIAWTTITTTTHNHDFSLERRRPAPSACAMWCSRRALKRVMPKRQKQSMGSGGPNNSSPGRDRRTSCFNPLTKQQQQTQPHQQQQQRQRQRQRQQQRRHTHNNINYNNSINNNNNSHQQQPHTIAHDKQQQATIIEPMGKANHADMQTWHVAGHAAEYVGGRAYCKA